MHQGVLEALAARSLLSEVLGEEFKIVVHPDSTAARAMALRSGPGRVKHVELKMMFIQELVKAKIVEVRKIGTLHDPADLLAKPVDQTTLERLLWSTGVSRLDAPEVAEVSKAVKKNMVHVKRHLSAFIVASVLAGAAGYEDDEQDDMNQGWSVKTLILFILFYGAYFGIITATWEAMKLGVRKLLSWIG